MLWRVALLLTVALALSACGEPDEAPTNDPAVTAEVEPTAFPTVTTAVPTPPSTEPAAPRTLVVWLVDGVEPDGETAAGEILAAQLAAYRTTHPELGVEVEVKSPSGQGGTLSYLRAGRGVAPAILPDLVVLPIDLLAPAAGEGLIYPLNEMLAADLGDDLFSAARAAGEVNGSLTGYPFALTSLTHVAYSSQTFTRTLPVTWTGLLAEEGARYVLPGAGSEGARLALQLYLDLGGTLVDETGRQRLDVPPLTAALSLLGRGRETGLIPLQSSNLATFEEAWQLFASGGANIIHTNAHEYLEARAEGRSAQPASAPGPNGPLTPLVRGLAWAVSTSDPLRQRRAVELLTWLVEPQNLGEWTYASHLLPARPRALDEWPADDPYVAFVRRELERAQPYPGTTGSTMMAALNQAVFEVLTQSKTPAAAAAEAAAARQG